MHETTRIPYRLNNLLTIETPENIFLEFEMAGLGSRFLAYLIDTVIQGLIVIALFYVVSIVFGVIGVIIQSERVFDTFYQAMLILLIFLLYQGYFIFLEVRWQGQSVGKRLLRLRVVKDNGYPIAFWDSVIRNILRAVDMLPPLVFFPSYGLGSVVILSSAEGKRIGDYAAGTLVIREKPYHGFERYVALRTNPEYIARIRIPNIRRIQGFDYYLLREFFFRKNLFGPEKRPKIAGRLAAYFRKKLEIRPELYTDDSRLLDDLMLLIESKKR